MKPRPRIYVGHNATVGKRPEVFKSLTPPTAASHGHLYAAVVGPFRTLRAAILDATTYPNPHIYHVDDAERIARRLAREGRL